MSCWEACNCAVADHHRVAQLARPKPYLLSRLLLRSSNPHFIYYVRQLSGVAGGGDLAAALAAGISAAVVQVGSVAGESAWQCGIAAATKDYGMLELCTNAVLPIELLDELKKRLVLC